MTKVITDGLAFQTALQELISRDSFYAPEIDIFKAVQMWSERNPEQDPTDIVKHIRLPLINMDDLFAVVRRSDLVSSEVILNAIENRHKSRDMDLNYRGFLSKHLTRLTLP